MHIETVRWFQKSLLAWMQCGRQMCAVLLEGFFCDFYFRKGEKRAVCWGSPANFTNVGFSMFVLNASTVLYALRAQVTHFSWDPPFDRFHEQGQLPTLGEVQGFLKIAFTDALRDNILWKTLPVRPNMTTKDVCELPLFACCTSQCLLDCISQTTSHVTCFLFVVSVGSPVCFPVADSIRLNGLAVCHWPVYELINIFLLKNCSCWCSFLSRIALNMCRS